MIDIDYFKRYNDDFGRVQSLQVRAQERTGARWREAGLPKV
jgi:hypothetical protein